MPGPGLSNMWPQCPGQTLTSSGSSSPTRKNTIWSQYSAHQVDTVVTALLDREKLCLPRRLSIQVREVPFRIVL